MKRGRDNRIERVSKIKFAQNLFLKETKNLNEFASHAAIDFLAAATTFSGVMPYSLKSVGPGADAPN